MCIIEIVINSPKTATVYFTFPCAVQHNIHKTVAIQFTVHCSTSHVLAKQVSTVLSTRNMVRRINHHYIIESLLKRTN